MFEFSVWNSRGDHELYDLATDPDERRNLADEPDQEERVAAMRRTLQEWFARYVEPAKDGRRFAVTGKGQMRPVGRGGDEEGAFADS